MADITPDCLRTIPDDDNKMKTENAMKLLLHELQIGIDSAEKEGWISEEAVRTHFYNRKNPIK